MTTSKVRPFQGEDGYCFRQIFKSHFVLLIACIEINAFLCNLDCSLQRVFDCAAQQYTLFLCRYTGKGRSKLRRKKNNVYVNHCYLTALKSYCFFVGISFYLTIWRRNHLLFFSFFSLAFLAFLFLQKLTAHQQNFLRTWCSWIPSASTFSFSM